MDIGRWDDWIYELKQNHDFSIINNDFVFFFKFLWIGSENVIQLLFQND